MKKKRMKLRVNPILLGRA
ncbi:hypothetical protein V2J09_018502 [Rumex salicifolius]